MPHLETIGIAKLLINPKNPRHEEVDSQRDAIEIMIENQKEKLYNLAVDIVNVGLNPSDIPIITPSKQLDNMYLILEGNRRITAIKLLIEPSLIPSKDKSLLKKFKDLSKQFNTFEFKEVNCMVFTYEEMKEAYHWVRIKHSGEMNGVGVVSWNAASIARFNEKMGSSSKALQVIDFIKEKAELDKKTKTKLESIAITNLERLVSDPQVREFLGIDFIDNKLHIYYKEKEVLKGLNKVIKDLALKKIDVNDIYYKDDRREYLENFAQKNIPDRSKKLDKVKDPLFIDKDLDNKTSEKENLDKKKLEKNKRQKSKHLSINRKKLIPSGCILRIDNKRIRSIYKELKSIYIDKHTNAVAVLFRVFLELSLDYYIEKHKLENIDQYSNLNKKVQVVANYFTNKKILNKQEVKPINIAVSSPNNILSIDTFHAYVHNKNIHPIAKDLKLTWDNIEKFIEKIWE